jgi:glycosyltransferase involved in cell wall biosynthesis
MPYKVMFLLTSLGIGGAERQLVQLLRRFSRADFEPVVVCLKEPGVLAAELVDLHIPVYNRLLSHKYDLRVLPRLISLIRKEQVHILWTRSLGDKMFWGRLAGKLARVPVILSSIHSMGKEEGQRSILGPLNRALTPITDRFIAVSELQKRFLIEEEGLPSEKIVVIYNRIDLDRFRPTRRPKEVKHSLDIPDGVPVIGQVAKLRPEKGHRVLLSAVRQIQRQGAEAVILLIGDGPERPGLQEESNRLGLEKNIRFLGDREDIPDLVNMIDIGSLSSYDYVETFPNAVLEYMALAKPVVASRVGGIPELVTEGVQGLLFQPGDAEAMASHFLFFLSQPERAAEMGRSGLNRIQTHFTLETSVQEIEQLFFSLLAEKGIR